MRAYYLDRIRIVLTILVIAHHSAITYGASGGWFLRLVDDESTSNLVLTLLAANPTSAGVGSPASPMARSSSIRLLS